jgi:hypothetical protein
VKVYRISSFSDSIGKVQPSKKKKEKRKNAIIVFPLHPLSVLPHLPHKWNKSSQTINVTCIHSTNSNTEQN